MYFKLSIRKLKHSAVLVFLLFTSILVKAQADFTISPTIACAGVDRTRVNITTPGIAAADLISFTVRWGIPNDTAVNARIAGQPPIPLFSKQYFNGGTYNITVVVKRNGGPDIVITKSIKIWQRPTTSFTLASSDNQCFKNNQYCFNNTSHQGTAPLVKYEWTFGDGNYRLITDTNNRNICHQYALNNPAYQVGLKVTDSVGCTTDPVTDLLSAKGVKLAPDINPKFEITGKAQCDTTFYIYKNTTAMSFANVYSFTFDYGDGTTYVSGPPHTVTEDFNRWSKPYTHGYTTNNVFRPSLIVKDKSSGCIDTFYYESTGLQLPENIIFQIELLTKRSIPNDSISCLFKQPVCIGLRVSCLNMFANSCNIT